MFRSYVLFIALALTHPSVADTTSFLPFLNFSSPSPYIFHSLSTLLQTWPQNVFPNGHPIASVTVPRHTRLYHGRHDNDPVPSPEWLAFDIEMAYGIMGSLQDSRMLTYRTTRDVKAVYFDGASANLMGEGTTSQMVLLYNGSDNVPERGPGRGRPPNRGHGDHAGRKLDNPPRRPPGHWNPLADEYFRARGLCEWLRIRGLGGVGWGYEGIVRMNAGFELIWCDFESPSLKLISNLNVSAPLLEDTQSSLSDEFAKTRRLGAQMRFRVVDEGPHGPGMTDPREPFRSSSNWFWFLAAAKRYFGDSRMTSDACGVFTFYDPELHNQSSARMQSDLEVLNLTADGRWQGPADGPSRKLDLQKLMRRRRQHSLDHVGSQDAAFMRHALEKRLKMVLREDGSCKTVNWQNVAREIVDTYSSGLQTLLREIKAGRSKSANSATIHDWFKSLRAITHWLVLPFLEYPPERPYGQERLKTLFSLDSTIAISTLERCQSQYDIDHYDFKAEEKVLYNSIKDTLDAVCSTIVEIGLDVEYHWLLNFNDVSADDQKPSKVASNSLLHNVERWEEKVEELMAWLGWVEQWSDCDPSCGADEICYIPMWPVSGFGRRGGPPPERPDNDHSFAAPSFGWTDSKFFWEPVCVNSTVYPPEEWD